MGLFQWLFGKKSKTPESSPKTLQEISPEITSEISSGKLIKLTGSETFSLFVVGESYYQDNLKQICGEYSVDGITNIFNATLIYADENQYDNQAIRVETLMTVPVTK